MRRILFVCVLFLFASGSSVFAQSEKAQAIKVSVDKDQLVSWSVNSHDFGAIPKGEPVKTIFKMKNLRNEPLLIDNVRTTCGCTAPTWTKDPILPGQETDIEVSYNAAKTGKFNKVIKVFLNGQKEAEALVISGEVIE